MKNEQFELTAERKKQLKEIKKENVIDRAVFVALSPAILAGLLIASPVAAVKAALKEKDFGAKNAMKAGAKGFVKPFSRTAKNVKKVFADGTAKLDKARKTFADEDLEKARKQAVNAAEKARKEAEAKAEAKRQEEAAIRAKENIEQAKKDGVWEMANSIANAVSVESVVADYVVLGYKVHFNNNVEMRIIAKDGNTPAKLNVFKSDEKEKYEIILSDYEYSLLVNKAREKKAKEKEIADSKYIASVLNLLKEGQRKTENVR